MVEYSSLDMMKRGEIKFIVGYKRTRNTGEWNNAHIVYKSKYKLPCSVCDDKSIHKRLCPNLCIERLCRFIEIFFDYWAQNVDLAKLKINEVFELEYAVVSENTAILKHELIWAKKDNLRILINKIK